MVQKFDLAAHVYAETHDPVKTVKAFMFNKRKMTSILKTLSEQDPYEQHQYVRNMLNKGSRVKCFKTGRPFFG